MNLFSPPHKILISFHIGLGFCSVVSLLAVCIPTAVQYSQSKWEAPRIDNEVPYIKLIPDSTVPTISDWFHATLRTL